MLCDFSKIILLCNAKFYFKDFYSLYMLYVFPDLYSPVHAVCIFRSLYPCTCCVYFQISIALYMMYVFSDLYSPVHAVCIFRSL